MKNVGFDRGGESKELGGWVNGRGFFERGLKGSGNEGGWEREGRGADHSAEPVQWVNEVMWMNRERKFNCHWQPESYW